MKTWEARVEHLGDQFYKLMEDWEVRSSLKGVWCEFPEFWDNLGGKVSARKGSLVKLAFIVGVYARISWELGTEFNIVPVREWKGQLPKEIVNRRIVEMVGLEACERVGLRTHAWDAAGIALFARGDF